MENTTQTLKKKKNDKMAPILEKKITIVIHGKK